MNTLRKFLEEKNSDILSRDIEKMAVKLGIKLTRSDIGDRSHYINQLKSRIIINQFQSQFGLDGEF